MDKGLADGPKQLQVVVEFGPQVLQLVLNPLHVVSREQVVSDVLFDGRDEPEELVGKDLVHVVVEDCEQQVHVHLEVCHE